MAMWAEVTEMRARAKLLARVANFMMIECSRRRGRGIGKGKERDGTEGERCLRED